MRLDDVQISQFRNLSDVRIHPATDLNLIIGDNGSGKSSVLEAIHYLGFGRSFRTLKHTHVINKESQHFTLFCRATDESGTTVKLGYQRNRIGEPVIKANGEVLNRVSELARLFPVQLFMPNSSDVITGAPRMRRRFLDWGVFHVEHGFLRASVTYQNLLRQSNALLRKKSLSKDDMLDYWLCKLGDAGEVLDRYRKAFFLSLKPYLIANLGEFLPEFCFEISYHSGWDSDNKLSDVLHLQQEKDRRFGHVSSGPHKADLRLKADGVSAHEVLSRGQLRMLMAALLLAQSQLLHRLKSRSCVFLLDDIGAELDEEKRKVFVDALLKTSAQVFITAIDKQQVSFVENYKDIKVFHVEHGQVREE
ncbi:DNA replication/repair protein RecF [Lacimicrobium alkaliphilum]|uniref:DNA replication and repair protein RecF n=1 Tax=Lacimicrobium alkaliphilum TaxID=1526571 RepID=A0ABQ1RMI5_9ALTE|nr:DNA replication/repair protein RecF [Lacimicrobium alkaliphilum]GGD71882.1 DNA replication and repair protein RecF [Lacimicrobium alkaliphilum]